MESKEKGMKVLSLSCRVSDEAWNTIHILASNLRKNPADLVAQLIEAYVKKQDKTKGTKIADDIELPLEELFREGGFENGKLEGAKAGGKNPNLSFGKIEKRTNQKTSHAIKTYLSFTE
jgi:hypothetical protein